MSYLKNGNKEWFQIAYGPVNLSFKNEFYADLYLKIYKGKIRHIMVAFRGTMPTRPSNLGEDAITWGDNVMLGNDFLTPIPTFWPYAEIFIHNVAKLIKEYDAADLLAPRVSYHITGHSLGGALANMVNAKAYILKMPHMKSYVPHVADTITFNSPGIGSMPISTSKFHQHRVITMRAEYDVVSCIGKPYGYIINNILPEGYASGKQGFELDHLLQIVNKWDPFIQLKEAADLTVAPTIAYDNRHFLGQHSMANFLKVIIAQSDCIALDFLRLRHWADQHGGLNHNFKSEPYWGQAPHSQAA